MEILIIDDEPYVCGILADVVTELGHEPVVAHSLAEGFRQNENRRIDVILLDIRLPDGNGLEAIPELKRTGAGPEVIIITGFGDPDGAELAIKSGAWHYIQKKDSVNKIVLSLQRVLEYRQIHTGCLRPPKVFKRCGIIGDSPPTTECIEKMARAAESDANVLLTGETGTGKELFARALHENSPRAGRNFIVIDCTALQETLVESTLFGHERGAFTGADKARDGLIRMADGGTLFLDEVGELSPPLQKSFLRVLQEKRFRPVGSRRELKSDFRLVAATNRDPVQLVEDNLFRRDLLYRLRTIAIELPPLRRRKEDIKPLTSHYVDHIAARNQLPPKGIAPGVIEMLCAYPWPGNVRELIATLEHAVVHAGQEQIVFTQHLPTSLRVSVTRKGLHASEERRVATMMDDRPQADQPIPVLPTNFAQFPPYKAYCTACKAIHDRLYFTRLMALAGRNINQACRVSGLSRTQIYTQLKRHHISRRNYRKNKA